MDSESLRQRELEELVKLVKLGDEKAFAEIYQLCFPTIYHYAVKVLGNEEDAKDATQETFVQVHRDIKNLKSSKKIMRWISSIAFNRCMDIHRKRKKIDRVVGELHRTEEFEFLPFVEEDIERKEVQLLVQQAIDQLPEAQKSVIVFFYFHGLSVKEIAEIQKTSIIAIKSKLFRARRTVLKEMRVSGYSSYKELSVIIPLMIPLQGKVSEEEKRRIFETIQQLVEVPEAATPVLFLSVRSVFETFFTGFLKLFTDRRIWMFLMIGSVGSLFVADQIISIQPDSRVENDSGMRVSSEQLDTGDKVSVEYENEEGVNSEVTQEVGTDKIISPALIINPIHSGDSSISGMGEPGKTIECTLSGGEKYSVYVDTDGTWTITLPRQVMQGEKLMLEVLGSATDEGSRRIVNIGV